MGGASVEDGVCVQNGMSALVMMKVFFVCLMVYVWHSSVTYFHVVG